MDMNIALCFVGGFIAGRLLGALAIRYAMRGRKEAA